MELVYTGIGSRQAPEIVLRTMCALGARLAAMGFVLRSGGAEGADAAFESGAMAEAGPASVERYLPWRGFNHHSQGIVVPMNGEAAKMAATLHPAWAGMSGASRKLHSRNVCQVLGDGLDKPSEFLVCWTPDGCESEHERSVNTGGTATAIVVACRHGIPVINLQRGLNEGVSRVEAQLSRLGVSAPTLEAG